MSAAHVVPHCPEDGTHLYAVHAVPGVFVWHVPALRHSCCSVDVRSLLHTLLPHVVVDA